MADCSRSGGAPHSPGRLHQLFVSATVLACLVMATVQPPVVAEPLRGSVEQFDVAKGWIPAERLPLQDWEKRVARRLKSGLAWSDNLLPAQGDDVKWVPVPPWLAGHWHIDRARFILDKNGQAAPDALNVEDDMFGFQQDRNGGYWQVLRNPTINQTEGPDSYCRFVHYEMNGNQTTPSQFVLEGDNLEVRVSKKTGKITNVRKRHDAYSWTISGGVVEADDKVVFLDNAMRPQEKGSGVVKARPLKTAPYKRVDVTGDGFQARQSFKAFLQKIGRTDLIPLD